MSLFDVDTSNSHRQSPAPNKVDQVAADARMSHGTQSVTYKVGTNAGVRITTKDTRIIANDGSRDVAIFGQQDDGTINLKFFDTDGIGIAQFGQYPDGSFALRVATSGVEVSTATDDQLVFDSRRKLFKIVDTDVVDLGTAVAGDPPVVVDVAHGLSTTPLVIAFATVTDFTFGTRIVPLPHYTLGTTGAIGPTAVVITAYIQMQTDDTKIRFVMEGPGITTSATVRYYIIQETAA